MLFTTFRMISVAILMTIGLMPVQSSLCASPVPSKTAKTLLAQSPGTPTPQQLEQQREAERVLKEGENLRRDIRDNQYNNNRDLDRQVGEQVIKVRESGSDPQKVREADAELTRLRQQNNRNNYYYDPFYYPYYYSTPAVIFYPSFSGNDPGYRTPTSPQPIDPNPNSIGQDNNGSRSQQDNGNSSTQVLNIVDIIGS